MNVGGLRVACVLRIPVGGTNYAQRNTPAPRYARGFLRRGHHQSPCSHDTVISGFTTRLKARRSSGKDQHLCRFEPPSSQELAPHPPNSAERAPQKSAV